MAVVNVVLGVIESFIYSISEHDSSTAWSVYLLIVMLFNYLNIELISEY